MSKRLLRVAFRRNLKFLAAICLGLNVYLWIRHHKPSDIDEVREGIRHQKKDIAGGLSYTEDTLIINRQGGNKANGTALAGDARNNVNPFQQVGLDSQQLSAGDTLISPARGGSTVPKNQQEDGLTHEENKNLTLVYKKEWAGFKGFDGSECKNALFFGTNNSRFDFRKRRTKPNELLSASENCTAFVSSYGFNRYPPVSAEELNFPLAFIILFHHSLDQVLFLLRAIYRPHNVYCLSVDAKSGDDFINTVRRVVSCIPNVFVASKLERVVYASFNRLMADIDCMTDLLQHPVQWKYLVNMPGEQFPLRTNLELVKIFTWFNGSNDIEGTTERQSSVVRRHTYKHINVKNNQTGQEEIVNTWEKNTPPPHGLEIVKGSTYGSFSRAFVEFALHHPVSRDFLEWCRNVLSPDEYFWSTLQHTDVVPVPGGYTGDLLQKPYVTSHSVWKGGNTTQCAYKYIHKICIFSPEDLVSLIQRNVLFANKFKIYAYPMTLHCLDEWLVNRTFSGIAGDLSYFRKLPHGKFRSLK